MGGGAGGALAIAAAMTASISADVGGRDGEALREEAVGGASYMSVQYFQNLLSSLLANTLLLEKAAEDSRSKVDLSPESPGDPVLRHLQASSPTCAEMVWT